MNLGYIDPGSGSLILQMILGGLAAAAVFLKMFWHRLLVLLRIRTPSQTPDRPADADAGSPASERAAFETAGEPAAKR